MEMQRFVQCPLSASFNDADISQMAATWTIILGFVVAAFVASQLGLAED